MIILKSEPKPDDRREKEREKRTDGRTDRQTATETILGIPLLHVSLNRKPETQIRSLLQPRSLPPTFFLSFFVTPQVDTGSPSTGLRQLSSLNFTFYSVAESALLSFEWPGSPTT